MKYSFPYGSIDAIFISHSHLDHFLGVYGLLETFSLTHRTKPLSLFFPDKARFKRYSFLNVKEISDGPLLETSFFTISAFPVEHEKNSFGFVFQEKDKVKFYEEKAKSLGIKGPLFREIQEKGWVVVNNRKILLEEVSWLKKGKKIVYTGDCIPSSRLLAEAKGADILIHDCTFSNALKEEAEKRKHSTPEMAATVAKKAGVRLLILTHFSPRYKDEKELEKEAKELFPNSIAAHDGFTLKIDGF